MPEIGIRGWAAAFVDAMAREVVFSTVVCTVVVVLCVTIGRRGAALRYALWSLVVVRLLLPPGLSHPLSAGAVAERLAGGVAIAGPRSVPAAELPAAAPRDAASAVGAMASDPFWPLPVAATWLVGVAVSAGFYRRRRGAFRRLVDAAQPLREPRLLATVEAWRRRLGIRRRVRLVGSEAPVSPFTFGVFRPVVFLPRRVVADPRLAEAAVAHELAHVARWDSLWLGLEHLARTLYFFHPVAWLAGARLEREREHLADALVLSHGSIPPRDYAASLLAALRLDLAGAGAVPLITTDKRRWTMRIQSILATSGQAGTKTGRALLATLVLGFFLLPLAGGEVAAEAPAVASASAVELTNPLPGSRVSAPWGDMKDPWNGEIVFHRGIDLVAAKETPILAAGAGTVEVATESYAPSESYGTVVIVDHGGGVKTFYAHLGSLEVREGQEVRSGETLARVGSTGRSTGPHLHFEAWRDGEPVDPAEVVADWRR